MLQKHKYILSKEVSQDVLSLLKEGCGLKKGVQHVMVSGNEINLKNSKVKLDLGHVNTCICCSKFSGHPYEHCNLGFRSLGSTGGFWFGVLRQVMSVSS